MIRLYLVATLALGQAGCATSGPGFVAPGAANFQPAPGDVFVKAAWYRDIVLGDVSSFHAPSTEGRLIIAADRLKFVFDDAATGSSLQIFEARFDEVTWITGKNHGVARILRIQVRGTAQSFLFNTTASDGTNKDEMLARTLFLFSPKATTKP